MSSVTSLSLFCYLLALVSIQALGDLELRVDNLDAARLRYEAALKIYPAIGDRLGEANVRESLGRLATSESDFETALAQFEIARQIHTEIGNQLGVGAVSTYAGRLKAKQGEFAQAILLFEAALTIDRQISDQYGSVIDLNDQANALVQLGEQQAALGAWWQALAIAQRVGLAQAQRLQGIFAQVAQNMGDGWGQFQVELNTHAEEWRLAGVVAAGAALEKAEEAG